MSKSEKSRGLPPLSAEENGGCTLSQRSTETIDFEKSLAELESIVKQLESGNLALEKSLALFERGVQLARACKEKLAEAEFKVNQLAKDKQGLFSEEAFEEDKD